VTIFTTDYLVTAEPAGLAANLSQQMKWLCEHRAMFSMSR